MARRSTVGSAIVPRPPLNCLLANFSKTASTCSCWRNSSVAREAALATSSCVNAKVPSDLLAWRTSSFRPVILVCAFAMFERRASIALPESRVSSANSFSLADTSLSWVPSSAMFCLDCLICSLLDARVDSIWLRKAAAVFSSSERNAEKEAFAEETGSPASMPTPLRGLRPADPPGPPARARSSLAASFSAALFSFCKAVALARSALRDANAASSAAMLFRSASD